MSDFTTSEAAPTAPAEAPRPGIVRRIVALLIASGLGFLIVIVLFLTSCQTTMIYFPRQYEPRFRNALPEGFELIEFKTSQGSQVAFYRPPTPNGESDIVAPRRLWIYTGGNASLALDWEDVALSHGDSADGHLLIDYPGYGACEGRPSPANIDESIAAAIYAVADHEGIDLLDLEDDIGAIGHSLGAAVALRVATNFRARRVILISPFTSMRDMARLVVGWPLNLLLHHNYDNRARLEQFSTMAGQGAVSIFHGELDEVIPVAMGRELAALQPNIVDYREVPKGDHNAIIGLIHQELLAAMAWAPEAAPSGAGK